MNDIGQIFTVSTGQKSSCWVWWPFSLGSPPVSWSGKTPFARILSSLWAFVQKGCDKPFWWPCKKPLKNLELDLEFWVTIWNRVGQIGGKWMGLQNFWNSACLHILSPLNQILRTFNLIKMIQVTLTWGPLIKKIKCSIFA